MLHDFKDGRTLILVATDVAARGLDVKDIRMVINFDFPKEMEVGAVSLSHGIKLIMVKVVVVLVYEWCVREEMKDLNFVL